MTGASDEKLLPDFPLRSLKWGRNQRFAFLLFGVCVGMMATTMYTQILVFSKKQDANAMVLALVISSRDDSKIAAEPAGFSAVESKEATSTDSSRKAIAQFIAEEKAQESAPVTTSVEPVNACGNSERWLKGPRYGNLRDPLLTDDLAQHMILNLQNVLLKDSGMSAVLGQTICHADSRFLNSTRPTETSYDDRTIRIWSVKLAYLAMHYHQHRLAVPEAVARYGADSKCPATYMNQQHNVGVFDYECPDAKYIVMSLSGNGLGANVRGGMVLALYMGLISDRIVIFVNNAAKGNRYLRTAWQLASCPREDYQCFFWATSPCTVTQEEIGDAYQLTMPEYRQLKQGKNPESIAHHKVLTFNSQFMPLVEKPVLAGERLYQYALTLISSVPEEQNLEYVALLKKAAEAIREKDGPRPTGYNYAAANLKVSHALSFYSVRPNPRNANELDRILTDIIPSNFQPENSFGLPIRGSDKCAGESECLAFDQYMKVTSDLWQRHQNATGTFVDPTVVFTTEAKSVVKEQQAFVTENGGQEYPFKFNFVTNTQDITPDSGFMKDIVRKSNRTSNADEAMLSSISSLKAQLLPRVTIGNCCSNFHAMLNDFLIDGCGAASDNTFMCLQEYEDPLLRVCCGWHHSCKAEKAEFRLNMSLAAATQ